VEIREHHVSDARHGCGQSTRENIAHWSDRASEHSYHPRQKIWSSDAETGTTGARPTDPFAYRRG
jgi:hypothetical protein